MPDAVLFDLDNTLLDRAASLGDFVRFQADGMLRTALDHTDRSATATARRTMSRHEAGIDVCSSVPIVDALRHPGLGAACP